MLKVAFGENLKKLIFDKFDIIFKVKLLIVFKIGIDDELVEGSADLLEELVIQESTDELKILNLSNIAEICSQIFDVLSYF